MQKIIFMNNFLMIILFTILFIFITEGNDEDLWKDFKSSTSKNIKKQKFIENLSIKEEIDVTNKIYQQQKANKIVIKSENCDENETEDIKPKVSQKIKKEPLDGHNNKLKIKIKLPKIESVKWNGEALENENDEQQQADQSNSSVDHSNYSADHINCSADDDEESNYTETKERRNDLEKNAKKLGTNHNNINKEKQKFGQIKKRKRENAETQIDLIRTFDQLKKEKIYGFKYEKKKCLQIEREIAESLGVYRNKIYELKNELGLTKKLSTNQQKLEKIKQFEKVKEAFSKKFNLASNWKIEIKIAEKIGVLYNTIYEWKRRFGLISRKMKSYTNAEKLEYVKNYEKIVKRNPKLSKEKIAEELGIPRSTLKLWVKKLGINRK